MTRAIKNPKTLRNILLFLIFFFLNSNPAKKPIIPRANICHGVHGPCPKKKFETKPVTAPTKNPVSAPKHNPEIIRIATVGLKWGVIKNTVLPATAMVHRTLITISSRAFGFRDSKHSKKGINVSSMISKLIK